MIDNLNILLGISLLGMSVAMLSIFLLDLQQLKRLFGKYKRRLNSRVGEIRGYIEKNKLDDEEHIRELISLYQADVRIGPVDLIRMTIAQSGVQLNFPQFIIITLILMIFGIFLGIGLQNVWVSIILTAGFSQSVWFYIRFKFQRRQSDFRATSSDVINQIFNLYEANQNLMLSISKATEHMPKHFKEIFERFLKETERYPFATAVDRMMRQVVDPTFRLFCSLLKVSDRMGVHINLELRVIKGIYDDEKEVRYQLANAMKKEQIEGAILATIAIGLPIIGFLLSPSDFFRLLRVSWVNSFLGLAITLIVVGVIMLPSIYRLEDE